MACPGSLSFGQPVLCPIEQIIFEKIRDGYLETTIIQGLEDGERVCVIGDSNKDNFRLLSQVLHIVEQ